MHPILTRYGSFLYYSYTAIMGLGLLLSLGLALRESRRRTGDGRRTVTGAAWLDGVIVALLAALLVGRIAFVTANWDYYVDNLDETWLLWQGGIGYHGAVGAGLIALWLWSRLREIPFAPLGGLLALPMALWTAFGWLACYLDGCVYGRETFFGPLSAGLPDSFGVFAVRYQTQLIGLALSLLALALLWWARRRLQPVALFWLAVLLLSAARALVDTLRGDPMPLVADLRLDLILDAAMALLALAALALTVKRDGISRPQNENLT